jgi:hypothetical protein
VFCFLSERQVGTPLALIHTVFAAFEGKGTTGRVKIRILPDKTPGIGHSCDYSDTHFKRKTAFNSKHISHVGGRGLLLSEKRKNI